MKTLVLGGGSFKNKAWVEETVSQLQPEIQTSPLFYKTWETQADSGIDFPLEIDKFIQLVDGQTFNVLAKSVGTLITMMALLKVSSLVDKIIICGLPLYDFSPEELENYKILANFPADKILCFQNDADPHGSFIEAREFLSKINPEIKLIEKIGNNHNYPYSQDFKKFLLNGQKT